MYCSWGRKVRFGVFVMALFSLGLGGFASVGGWEEVMKASESYFQHILLLSTYSHSRAEFGVATR
jgi:hypothetical protein